MPFFGTRDKYTLVFEITFTYAGGYFSCNYDGPKYTVAGISNHPWFYIGYGDDKKSNIKIAFSSTGLYLLTFESITQGHTYCGLETTSINKNLSNRAVQEIFYGYTDSNGTQEKGIYLVAVFEKPTSDTNNNIIPNWNLGDSLIPLRIMGVSSKASEMMYVTKIS